MVNGAIDDPGAPALERAAAPVAHDGSIATDEDTPLPFGLQATGAGLAYSIVSGPAHGTLTGDGAARTYAPVADYHGPDSLTFRVDDGQQDSNVATVSFVVRPVNDAPRCNALTLTVEHATAGELAPVCSDVDGDSLSISVASQGTKGVASLVAGRLHYEPRAEESGTDTFAYRAFDGTAQSTTATMTVTIKPRSTPANDPPRCADSTATTITTSPFSGSVRCTDADGDPLTYTVANAPVHGSLTLNPDGSFRYVAAGYTGPDKFAYTAADGRGGSGGATVHVSVLAKPDKTPPSCEFAYAGRDAAGKARVDATLRDTGSGLAWLRVVSAVNASVTIPVFSTGTTAKVVVRTIEIDSSRPNNVTLEAIDVAGNVTTCDPIVVRLTRSRTSVLRGVPRAESKLRLINGRPGLTRLDVIVNGRRFALSGLRAGQRRFVDLARAMRPGRRNRIVLRPHGRRGSSATILIADR